MRYLPPARLDDFDRSENAEQLKQTWHDDVKGQIDAYRQLPRFLDPLTASPTAARESFPWPGFPRTFESRLDIDNHPERLERAFRSAEQLRQLVIVGVETEDAFSYAPLPPNFNSGIAYYPIVDGIMDRSRPTAFWERPQDEYLEWHVIRDQDGRAIRMDFTAEPPEYWDILGNGDRALTTKLYGELLKAPVPEEDLFHRTPLAQPVLKRGPDGFEIARYQTLHGIEPGTYNRYNRWNTELGCVHLTQTNNTLFAEINLAARATQRFAVRPDLTSDADRFALTACGGFGAVNRHSDPTIGFGVNTLALADLRVMVSNPVGLYVGEVDLGGFRDPAGNPVDPDEILTVQRGSFNDQDGLPRVVRFSIHPPAGADYGLNECSLDGLRLNSGGPVARNTTVVIHGVAEPSTTPNPLVDCFDEACAHPTRRPTQYLAVPLGEACPIEGHPDWDDGAPLAPGTGQVMRSHRLAMMMGQGR